MSPSPHAGRGIDAKASARSCSNFSLYPYRCQSGSLSELRCFCLMMSIFSCTFLEANRARHPSRPRVHVLCAVMIAPCGMPVWAQGSFCAAVGGVGIEVGSTNGWGLAASEAEAPAAAAAAAVAVLAANASVGGADSCNPASVPLGDACTGPCECIAVCRCMGGIAAWWCAWNE